MAAPLRIIATAPTYCHPDWRGSGVARMATDFSLALAKRGHRITLVSVLNDLGKVFDLPEKRTFDGANGGQLTLEYVSGATPTKFGPMRGNLKAVLKPLLAGADVVHCHSFLSPFSDGVCAMARRAGVPYCVQDHGKLTPSILANRGGAKKLYLILRGWGLLRDAAGVFLCAEPPRRALLAGHPKMRTAVVMNGIDPAEYTAHPPSPLPGKYVLFLGWLDPRKNPDLLVDAFAKAAPSCPDWKLALVGPDSYGMGDLLRAKIASHNLGDRVVMPGSVKGDAKMAWFKNAGVFVLPSTGEGLSVAMIEAIGCGLPCLLSPGCNFPEIQTGAGVPGAESGAGLELPLTVDAWAEGLKRAMSNPAQLATWSANANRMFGQLFTLERTTAALEQALLRAIGKPV